MGFFIRTLLIWLMVLAVPAQGAVAATMAFCGPNHHGGAATGSDQQAGPSKHANHHGDGHGTPGHHDTAQADEVDAASARPAASSQASHAVKQTCSTCASCCSLGAILSPLLAVPAPAVTPTVFSAVVPTVSAFAVDGPDRPPRIVLA